MHRSIDVCGEIFYAFVSIEKAHCLAYRHRLSKYVFDNIGLMKPREQFIFFLAMHSDVFIKTS